MGNDHVDHRQLVVIREARLLAQHLTREEEDQARSLTGQSPGVPPPPIRKYLYIFSSDDLDYGLQLGQADCLRGYSLYSHQHMAHLDPAAVNPPKSGTRAVGRIEREIYFDSRGLAHEISITNTWQKPRHQRPHPLFGQVPSDRWDEIEERMMSGRGAKPVGGRAGVNLPPAVKGKLRRYYLLLSPIRLGPKALQFAKDNPDALTLYFDPLESLSNNRISGPGPTAPKNLNPTDRKRRLSTLDVVDPYAYAERIRTKLLAPVQDQFYAYLTSVEHGDVKGVEKRHFHAHDNRGTLAELVSLANLVSRIQAHDQDLKDLVDQASLQEVLGIYGARLETHVRLIETTSRFYANWLTGPQHQAIDLGVVEDLNDPADQTAGLDKASSLAHWFCQFRAAQATGQGAGIIAELLSDKTKLLNPIRDLFLKYTGSKPSAGSTDLHALHAIGDLVPDLALYVYFQFKPGELDAAGKPIPDKAAPARAKALADLVNNIAYFNTQLGTDEHKDPQKEQFKEAKKGKYAFKSVLYAIESPLKSAQWVADPFRNAKTADLSNGLFRRTLERALGFEPIGAMLKEKAVFISSETDPEFLRRTALQMENNIADLRKDALALYQEYNAALVRSADRINPLYSQMKAWDIVCNKEMSALDRDISRVSGEIDKVPYDVVGRADGPQLIRKRNTLIGELETLTLRKLELRNQVADIGKDISKIEAAARQANVDLNAARTNAVSIANRANSNYNLWKNFEKEKSLNLKTNLANVNQRIEEVAARNLTRQRNLADKGREIGPIKVYASAAFLLLEFAMFGATMSDQHASKKDRSWAFADLGKGFVDFGKDYLSARGIRPELLPKGSVSKLFVLSGTDAALLKEASNLRLKVASGALGILGGLHTVIKYGPQSVKDWRSDDVDASLFAGMAAFGGVLTIVVAIAPFVGFMSVSAASGVGAIASLLTAVGILVYIFVVDSEYEKILKNCYFAKKPTQRNNRFSTSTTHWMGPADPEAPEGFWGVREQLAALTRLSCRFEVTSQANVLNFPTNSFFAEEYPSNEPIQFSALFVLSFNGVPKGASIFIDLRAFQFGGESTQIHALRTSEFEVGAKWNSDKTTLTGRFAPADQSGFILINLKQKSAAFFHRIAANIEYTLPDGSMIKHEHDLIKMKIDSIADNAGGTTHRYYCEVQDGSTYATSFESVPATTYS